MCVSPFSVQFKTKSVVALLPYMLSWLAEGNFTVFFNSSNWHDRSMNSGI